MRATRAARLFVLVQPIISFICGVVVDIAKSSFLKLPINQKQLKTVAKNPK